MVPAVDLDMSVSGRVILEPHQVEMEHRGRPTKDHPLLCLLEEGRDEEGEGRRREAVTGGGRNVPKFL